jgi:hypothetical protein
MIHFLPGRRDAYSRCGKAEDNEGNQTEPGILTCPTNGGDSDKPNGRHNPTFRV